MDTNVFLYTAQGHRPDFDYFCRVSTDFLERPQGAYFISNLVLTEVLYQLRTYAHEYRGANRIRRRLADCQVLPTDSRAALIGELAEAYADDGSEEGWRGGSNDNDRWHAAAASVFGLNLLATWDEAFTDREAHIKTVNARFGRSQLTLVWPIP